MIQNLVLSKFRRKVTLKVYSFPELSQFLVIPGLIKSRYGRFLNLLEVKQENRTNLHLIYTLLKTLNK